jgi:hypothetical protein
MPKRERVDDQSYSFSLCQGKRKLQARYGRKLRGFTTEFEIRVLTDAKNNDTCGTRWFKQVQIFLRIKILRHRCEE